MNGETSHNNPAEPDFYVPGEPPRFPRTHFNYLGFCFRNNIVRIGWPDTGDLLAAPKTGALANGYSMATVPKHVRAYLVDFSQIQPGSIVLVPDKDRSGDVYVCRVARPYHYLHHVPRDPYECAHRLGVEWDRDPGGQPIRYHARELGLSTKGGIWLRAFHALDRTDSGRTAIPHIDAARAASRQG